MLVVDEFTAQSKKEKKLGLAQTPFMANLDSEEAIAQLQVGFDSYVVAPLWEAIALMLPNAKEQCKSLESHIEIWKSKVPNEKK